MINSYTRLAHSHNCLKTHIVWVQKLIPHNGKSHLRTAHQSHTHTDSQIHFTLPVRAGVSAAPAMHSSAVFSSWLMRSPLFLLLTRGCMCVKSAFASMHWPLHRWIIEFLSVSPQPIFFWRKLWIDIYRAPTFCLHRIGVNQCTVWYPSPRVTLKLLRGFRGGNITLASWIYLLRQNLR